MSLIPWGDFFSFFILSQALGLSLPVLGLPGERGSGTLLRGWWCAERARSLQMEEWDLGRSWVLM